MEVKISRKMAIIMWKKFKRTAKRAFKFIFSFHFGKFLMLLLTAIVSYLTYEGVVIAKMCIIYGYTGALPWIATMLASAYAAFGTMGSFFFNKGKAEEVTKIKMNGGKQVVDYGSGCDDGSVPTI